MPLRPTTRRQSPAATALGVLATPAPVRTLREALPWAPNEAYPPEPVLPGPWRFFAADEAAAVEAIADRLIPADELGPGGREAGCAVFLDRQSAGPYGSGERLYQGSARPAAAAPDLTIGMRTS